MSRIDVDTAQTIRALRTEVDVLHRRLTDLQALWRAGLHEAQRQGNAHIEAALTDPGTDETEGTR